MATCSSFSDAISYALDNLGSANLSLKEEQLQSTQAAYQGKSVFVWLPTGFGKSICYQALLFVLDHKLGLVDTPRSSTVLVASPLTALMVDQVQKLRSRGVKSSIITSGSDLAKCFLATESSLSTDSLLFCAPEALALPRWRDVLENSAVAEGVVAVVLDEAHCVSNCQVVS